MKKFLVIYVEEDYTIHTWIGEANNDWAACLQLKQLNNRIEKINKARNEETSEQDGDQSIISVDDLREEFDNEGVDNFSVEVLS